MRFPGCRSGLIILIALVVILRFGLIFLLYWLGARGQNSCSSTTSCAIAARSPGPGELRASGEQPLRFLSAFHGHFVRDFPADSHRGGGDVHPAVSAASLAGGWRNRRVRCAGAGLSSSWRLSIELCLFVFREFGVPLMFRQGLLARPAFWRSMNLIRQHPAAWLSLSCCASRSSSAWPSLGHPCCVTLLLRDAALCRDGHLLPVLIFVRCFTLDCLAQFGPEYDVWTVDVPPAGTAYMPPFSPPPPPG
jgi:hypothetical protein